MTTSPPEWKPSTDGELDAWGRGYLTGWERGYADALEAAGLGRAVDPEDRTGVALTAKED